MPSACGRSPTIDARRDAACRKLRGQHPRDRRRHALERQDDQAGERDQAPSPDSLVLLPKVRRR
jgi:hypothetical protein